MRNRCLAVIVCLAIFAATSVTTGCRGYFSEERHDYRSRTIQADRERMSDDWDWIWGLDEPATTHERTFPPHSY